MIKYYHGSDINLVASSENSVQLLTIDKANKKIKRLNCNLGNIKRSFSCLAIDRNDGFAYAGTVTGTYIYG